MARSFVRLAAMALMWTGGGMASAQQAPTPFDWAEENAYTLGVQAFIYSYPWMYMQKALWDRSDGMGQPINELTHRRNLTDASHTLGGAPNNDTLYSGSWVHLDEPVILSVPAIEGRYYSFQFVDFMGDNFAYVGTRTTGTVPGNYAIVGPGWKGKLPDDVTRLPRSSTIWAFVLGRTMVDGKDDLPAVHALQDQYKLTPLSRWHRSAAGAPAKPVIWQPYDRTSDPLADWKTINRAMAEVPAPAADADLLRSMARIGIGPGLDVEAKDASTKRGLARAATTGQKIVVRAFAGGYSQKQVNGWNYPSPATGRLTATRDWLIRAFQAAVGFVANDPEEAIYLNVSLDDRGLPLNGANRYEIRFEKGMQPPVKAFWSITMYNLQYNLVANPIDRYSLGDRSDIKTAPDGSLTIYVQSEPPGEEKLSNWLPAPAGDFFLFLRAYLPGPTMLDQTWQPPAVTRVP